MQQIYCHLTNYKTPSQYVNQHQSYMITTVCNYTAICNQQVITMVTLKQVITMAKIIQVITHRQLPHSYMCAQWQHQHK